jgi:hypothetical protein
VNDRCRRNEANGWIRISAGSNGLGDFFGFLDRLVDDGLSIAYGLDNDAAIDDWSADDRERAPKVAGVRREERQDFNNAIVVSSLLSQHCLLFVVLLLTTRQFKARGKISSPLSQIGDKR